ncbi:MAG: hypothetical protein AABZ55_02720, partial [Bdellovibrionota bacterium]
MFSTPGRLWGALVVLVLGSSLLLAAGVANGPDFDAKFDREVKSEIHSQDLQSAFDHVDQWSHWFFSLKEARSLDHNGNPLSIKDQIPFAGSKIRMYFDPKKGERKRF